MDFTAFVQQYKAAKNKDALVKKHIKKTYVPYAEKLSRAHGIAATCTHAAKDHPEIYKKDTPTQYFATIMHLIEMYADLDFSGTDFVKAFDTMSECGLIEAILASIPESEVVLFRTLVDMCVSDIYENEHDLSSVVERKLNALSLYLNTSFDSIQDTLKDPDLSENTEENVFRFSTKTKPSKNK